MSSYKQASICKDPTTHLKHKKEKREKEEGLCER